MDNRTIRKTARKRLLSNYGTSFLTLLLDYAFTGVAVYLFLQLDKRIRLNETFMAYVLFGAFGILWSIPFTACVQSQFLRIWRGKARGAAGVFDLLSRYWLVMKTTLLRDLIVGLVSGLWAFAFGLCLSLILTLFSVSGIGIIFLIVGCLFIMYKTIQITLRYCMVDFLLYDAIQTDPQPFGITPSKITSLSKDIMQGNYDRAFKMDLHIICVYALYAVSVLLAGLLITGEAPVLYSVSTYGSVQFDLSLLPQLTDTSGAIITILIALIPGFIIAPYSYMMHAGLYDTLIAEPETAAFLAANDIVPCAERILNASEIQTPTKLSDILLSEARPTESSEPINPSPTVASKAEAPDKPEETDNNQEI